MPFSYTPPPPPGPAVQRGLPGVVAEEEALPSERVLSGELLGERRREAFRGMRAALGERPEGFTREEFAVAVSLLCPPHLPPGTSSARASMAYRARECFPGYPGPAALRAYQEHKDRPHVAELVATFRALEALDVQAQRGLWRDHLHLAAESIAARLRDGEAAGLEPADLARLAAALTATVKVAADFDALQAPRAVVEAPDASQAASRQVDAHRALAENLERVAADLRERAKGAPGADS